VILQTERLVLRKLTRADLPALKAILQDPHTMAAYEGPFSDLEVETGLDKTLTSYQDNGFGLWGVQVEISGDVIGQCGITWQTIAGDNVLEVGYRFNRNHWHYGYATEAALACRDWAFDRLGADRVYAKIRDTNIASMNVAIRLGMTVRSRFVIRYRGIDMPHYAFAIDKETAAHR
jgi:RimJ/RimL family protein N-acetyltransferase